MYSNPDHALSEIKAICARVKREVELNDIFRESEYMASIMKRFSQTTGASASDELVDSAQKNRAL